MGMKGGCSPQNTLRLKHSFLGCKLNIRKSYRRPIAPSDHDAQPESSLDLWTDRTIAFGAATAGAYNPGGRGSPFQSGDTGQLFDLRHDAVQLADQGVVAMPAKSYN